VTEETPQHVGVQYSTERVRISGGIAGSTSPVRKGNIHQRLEYIIILFDEHYE
jgi:hypothetical protein